MALGNNHFGGGQHGPVYLGRYERRCALRGLEGLPHKIYFANEQMGDIRRAYLTIPGKYQELFLGYVTRTFRNSRAQEYATQGFSRRLKILVQCIDKVFEILPPDRTTLPTSDELSDAMINIQAFVFNVFGSMDNLAWIWACEKGLKNKDGSPISARMVGLGQKNELVRGSFSKEFQDYLKGLNDWFEFQENYRHALAHRIPLYIPPYTVSRDQEAAYKELEERKTEAIKRRDFAEYDRLSAEQDARGAFRPWIMHSFEEMAKPVVFHPQLLSDFDTFDTIVALGQKMLREFDR